jgi:ABC-type oligopeptide transport system substrate-binding subunit
MSRRLLTGVGALALGAALFLTAQLAGAERGFKQGGVFRYGTTDASVRIDPQIAYITTAWWLEYATAAKLFNYPDRRGQAGAILRQEVASGYRISRDGRTWTFFIRKGFRFSDGSPVTARSFAYAIDRAANKQLASPAAAFITDPNGANIVGAKAVNDGKARHVRGVGVQGNRLTIRLTRRDPTLLTKLAMPFFQATSSKLQLNREITTGYPSAGPYFFDRNQVDSVTELARNPYYRGTRRRSLSRVEVRWNLNEQQAFDQVLANELDEGPLPTHEVRRVAGRFGVNKTRFWVEPTLCLGYLALNSRRPLFRNNFAWRKAINWMVDRRAALAGAPPYAGSAWTHLLPPGFPGSITAKRLQPYADAPNPRKALRLAAGRLRKGVVNVGYRRSGSSGVAQAQYVRTILIKLGIAADRIRLKEFSGGDIYDVIGKRNSDLDLGVSLGWCADYPDPQGLLGSLLGWAAPYVDSSRFGSKLEAAANLQGAARLRAFGRLDIELMKELAPIVVMRTYNNRFFFSARVDPKSLVYQGVYQDWSIAALALK